MNVAKAILDHAPAAIQELEQERGRLLVRLGEIQGELAMWQVLKEVVGIAVIEVESG